MTIFAGNPSRNPSMPTPRRPLGSEPPTNLEMSDPRLVGGNGNPFTGGAGPPIATPPKPDGLPRGQRGLMK
jgi:hypothetical protein